MCLFHFLMVYPVLMGLFWGCQILTLLLTGCLSSTTAGDFPLISATMREFWGKRSAFPRRALLWSGFRVAFQKNVPPLFSAETAMSRPRDGLITYALPPYAA